MLRKRPTQPSFLPRSASCIPGGLCGCLQSELKRGPGAQAFTGAAPWSPGGFCAHRAPPGTPWIFFHPRPSTLSSLSFSVHQGVGPGLGHGKGDLGSLGAVWGCREETPERLRGGCGGGGGQSHSSHALACTTSVKVQGVCCLPTPHDHHQPQPHTFSGWTADLRLKRPSHKGENQ